MSAEATEHLIEKITDAIDYARKEYTITYVEVIGALELVKAEIATEALEDSEEKEGRRG